MKNLRISVILCLFIACVAQANQLDIVENTVVAETDAYIIHFQAGAVTHLYNKLTAETYTSLTSASADTAVLTWAGELGYGDESILWVNPTDFQLKQIDPMTVRCDFADGQTQLAIWIAIDPGTGDFLIQQEATSKKESVADIAWQIRNLESANLDVIVPRDGGSVINDADPREVVNCSYPSLYWEAQLMIGQKHNGGFSVQSTDKTFRYKHFTYVRENSRVSLGFSTENDAPFTELTAIESVEWRINTHRGDWQVPAGVYRDWMVEAYDLDTFLARRPSWVDDINFVVHGTHNDIGLPKLLKAHGIVPEQTIYISPRGEDDATAQAVRDMGFRLFFSANARGVFPDESIYEQFKKHQIVEPWSSEGHTFGTPGSTANHDAWHIYVSPASLEWEDYFIERIRRMYENAPFDGLYLDVSHLVPNDHNADMYGVRTPQGAIRMRTRLLQEFPSIALLGESNHEVFLNQGSFAMVGFHGESAHPISHFLFDPFIQSLMPRMRPDWEPEATIDAIEIRNQLPELYVWHYHHLNTTCPEHYDDTTHLEVMKLIKAVALWQKDPAQSWVDIFRTTEPAVLLDVNADDRINILDLVIVANDFGGDVYDLNCDGSVNILDLVIVANNFGN